MTNKYFWIPVRSYKNAEYQPWEPQYTHPMFIKPQDKRFTHKRNCQLLCKIRNENEKIKSLQSHSFEIQ